MQRTTLRSRASSVALTALLSAALAGCSSEEAASGGGSGDGITVQTAQFSWTAAGLTNGILGEIAADHPDLGVSSLATTQVDPAAARAGAARGDIDVASGVEGGLLSSCSRSARPADGGVRPPDGPVAAPAGPDAPIGSRRLGALGAPGDPHVTGSASRPVSLLRHTWSDRQGARGAWCPWCSLTGRALAAPG